MSDLTDRIREVWPELVQADCDRNAGMSLELFSAESYARLDGMTPEKYIIAVLRQDRERRQILDGIVSNKALLDEEIDAAAAAGISLTEHVAAKLTNAGSNRKGEVFRPEDISPDFLRKALRRMEERAAT